MSSDSRVFEVVIHCAEADTDAATLLQQRLRQDGIRAAVADLHTAKVTRAFRAARHSLCFVGSTFDEYDVTETPRDRFDFVFISPGAESAECKGNRCTSYSTLIEGLARDCEGATISSPGLRRATRISYDTIADQFTDVWFDTVPGEAIETLIKHLPHGSTLLDAGCGPGHHVRFFKKAGLYPVGLDFSRAMLDIAAKKNNHIPFIHGDILSYALPKLCFDGVWSAVTINHIPAEEVLLALENLVATLKFEGFIGLNFQVGRQSEIVSRDGDQRFFEYPVDENCIVYLLEALGVRVVATHFGTTTRNIHGLTLELHFATIVGQKMMAC